MDTLARLMIPFVCCIAIPSAGALAQSDIAATYRSGQAEIRDLEQQLADQIRNDDLDGFLARFSSLEKDAKPLADWFQQLRDLRKKDELDRVVVDLPPFVISSTRAVIRNGRLDAYLASGALKRCGLPPVTLEQRDGQWVFKACTYAPSKATPEAEVTTAVFRAKVSQASCSVDVTADLNVTNKGPDKLAQLPVFLRYPLRIESATLDGKPFEANVTIFTIGNVPVARWMVPLPTPLAAGDSAKLTFRYSASFEHHDWGRKPVGFTSNPDRGFILWESGWYPSFSQELKTFPYEMSISVPEGQSALSVAESTATQKSDGMRCFSYRTAKPEAPCLLWGRYKETSRKSGDTELVIWTPDDGSIDPAPMMKLLDDVFSLFRELLPPPQLQRQRAVAVTRFGGYGATGNLLLEDRYFSAQGIATPENLDFVAHELSHSWVNSISPSEGKDRFFLSEGLATYLGAKAVERLRGKEAATAIWRKDHASFGDVAYRAVAPEELNEDIQAKDNQMFRAVAYVKGAYLFRELESQLGEKQVLDALRKAMLAKKGGSLTLDDLLTQVNKLSGKDVSSFFSLIQRKAGCPDYAISGVEGKDSLRFVKITNLGEISPTPVEVVAYDQAMKEIERKTVTVDTKEGVAVEFSPEKPIAHLAVDPDRLVLQAEDRNDVYPDCILAADDMKEVEGLIAELFRIFQAKDDAALDKLLTNDVKLLEAEQRASMMAMVKAGRLAALKPTGSTKIFAKAGGQADVLLDIDVETPSGVKKALGEFSFVKDGKNWKAGQLRVRTR